MCPTCVQSLRHSARPECCTCLYCSHSRQRADLALALHDAQAKLKAVACLAAYSRILCRFTGHRTMADYKTDAWLGSQGFRRVSVAKWGQSEFRNHLLSRLG